MLKKITLITIISLIIPNIWAQHFSPIWSGNGYNNMTFFVSSATIDGVDMEADDEIGIFDGNNCVGAGILTGPITTQSILQIVASEDNPLTPSLIDGFIEGNTISYKLWDSSSGIEILSPDVNYVMGNDTFSQFSTAMIEISSAGDLPEVPENVIISIIGNDIELNWDACLNAVSYNVYRSESPNSNFTLIGNSTSTSYLDTNAGMQNKYFYYITAIYNTDMEAIYDIDSNKNKQ